MRNSQNNGYRIVKNINPGLFLRRTFILLPHHLFLRVCYYYFTIIIFNYFFYLHIIQTSICVGDVYKVRDLVFKVPHIKDVEMESTESLVCYFRTVLKLSESRPSISQFQLISYYYLSLKMLVQGFWRYMIMILLNFQIVIVQPNRICASLITILIL